MPFARLPSSSSAARSTRQRVPVAQPSEVQAAAAVLQVKALPAADRERYQSRSTTAQAALPPPPGRSRAAKSQTASEGT